MSIFGGSGGTESKTVNNEPWAPAQPHLNEIMGRAQTYVNQGIGTGIYPGPVQPGMDPNTSMALRGIQNTALNTNTQQPFQFGNQMIQGGGMTGGMNPALNTLHAAATGTQGMGLTTGARYGNIADRAQSANPEVQNMLSGVATGQAGITTAPQIDTLYNHALNQNATRKGILDQGAGGVLDNPMAFAYRDVSNRAANPTAAEGFDRSGMQGIANRNTGPTFSERFLDDIAGGGNVNEFANRQADINARRIKDQVASSMSGSGRYGSFGHAAALTDRISEANNPMLMAARESDLNRQLQATSQMDTSRATADNIGLAANRGVLDSTVAADATRNAANQTRLGAIGGETGIYDANANRRLNSAVQGINAAQGDVSLGGGLLNQLTGVQNQNIGNAMNAGRSLADIRNNQFNTELNAVTGQTGVQDRNIANTTGAADRLINQYGQGLDRSAQWAGMMPGLNNLQYDPYTRLGQVGNEIERRQQTDIDAERMRFQQEQQQPWQQLNNYLGAVSGLGNIIGQAGTQTMDASKTAPWFGANQGLFGGMGSAAGTAMQMLPLLMGLSDRNAKTDIKKLGKDDPNTGLPLYAYRYKGDPKSYPKIVGPMAQDAAKKYPHKVHNVGGLLAIDADLMPKASGLLGAM